MLRDLSFQEDYRTGEDNLLHDFLRPTLKHAKQYWRAVGFFSSSAFEVLGKPLGDFIASGGTMRIVTSVQLSEEDVKAIEKGLEVRKAIQSALMASIDAFVCGPIQDGADALLNLLAHGRLEIKLAVPSKGNGYGIYHEKVGIFLDDQDYVAFSGSSNESKQAFEGNYESIDVFPSWVDLKRAARKKTHFEKLWLGKSAGVDVFEFPEAAKKNLIQAYQKNQNTKTNSPHSKLWLHQQEAIKIFMTQKRGILDMATGTGKTRTALEIIRTLFQAQEINSAIIAADGNDLLDQWHTQLLAHSREYDKPLRVYRHYSTHKEAAKYRLDPQEAIFVCSRENLPKVLRDNSNAAMTLLIHDEVHRLGSPGNREALNGLSDPYKWRLGLSATPDREYDDEGNKFIEHHIGPVLFEFGLQDAIQNKILCPFNYFPIHYMPNEEDQERQKNVYKMVAARKAEGWPMSQEEIWIELAKVHKLSRAKLPPFYDFISRRPELLQRCIIFVETMEYGDEVLDIVHEISPNFHTYYSGQDSETLFQFARGELDCLLTCHRLSEGIDVKSIGTVVLFSSSRARLETIQRIGRCLRIDPDNSEKVASVVDFIRDDNDPENADQQRAAWLSGVGVAQPI